MDPAQGVNEAGQILERMAGTIDNLHGQIDAMQRNDMYAPEYKRQQVDALREQLYGALREGRADVEGYLERAGKNAEQILGGMRTPGDAAAANAQMLAAPRVASALQQLAPAAAAEVFAEAGDVPALRALYAQIPVHVAATVQGTATSRAPIIRELQDSVERRLEALASPAEASAIRARRGIAGHKERLDKLTDFALNPSPHQRMALSYALDQ
jgi:hypothetical protein